jgi:hypothetical protein
MCSVNSSNSIFEKEKELRVIGYLFRERSRDIYRLDSRLIYILREEVFYNFVVYLIYCLYTLLESFRKLSY